MREITPAHTRHTLLRAAPGTLVSLTYLRTLEELGQAAGRLLALNEYLEQHPQYCPQRSSVDRHHQGVVW